MIKLNSPIWQKQNPPCIALRNGFPLSRIPNVAALLLTTITTAAITTMGSQCLTSTPGSTNMPTDTKNTAPNRFFKGVIIL